MTIEHSLDDAGRQVLLEYLKRIQYADSSTTQLEAVPAANLDTLTTIHRLHTLNIPFENLIFIHHSLKGKQRLVDYANLHKRIVLKQRGGMCQEMNGILKHILNLLGFDCYSGIAAVVTAGSFKPAAQPLQGLVTSHNLGNSQECAGTHQIILVQVNSLWYLCDVGFGGQGLVEPILLRAYDDVDDKGPTQQAPPADWLAAQGESVHGGSRFRLRRGVLGSAEPLSTADALTHPEAVSHVGYYLQACIKDAWTDQYWFGLTVVTPQVLQACSDYSFQHHPLFTKHMVVAKPIEGGRITLMDFALKIRRPGQPTEERQLQSEQERDEVLQEMFGIDIVNGRHEETN